MHWTWGQGASHGNGQRKWSTKVHAASWRTHHKKCFMLWRELVWTCFHHFLLPVPCSGKACTRWSHCMVQVDPNGSLDNLAMAYRSHSLPLGPRTTKSVACAGLILLIWRPALLVRLYDVLRRAWWFLSWRQTWNAVPWFAGWPGQSSAAPWCSEVSCVQSCSDVSTALLYLNSGDLVMLGAYICSLLR